MNYATYNRHDKLKYEGFEFTTLVVIGIDYIGS
jgi:hypothetical protein